jgi:type I restriction enzyme S subunit
MSPDELLRHFERVSEAPGAVDRLRRFAIELAVRGALTERGPLDRPVSVDLGRAANLIDSSKWTAGQCESAPAAWTRCPMICIGKWGSGGTPRTGHPEYYDGGIPWLMVSDLNNGVVTSSEKTISEAGLQQSSTKIVPRGTVFVALYGSIGKCGIAGIECCTNQAIGHCIPDRNVATSEFLLRLIQGLGRDLTSRGQGGAQQNISQTIIKHLSVAIPPLAEQRRIVAKVDELMALCDRLEAAQAERERWRDRVAAASLHRLNNPANNPATFQAHARFHFQHVARTTTRLELVGQLREAVLGLAMRGSLSSTITTDQAGSEPAGSEVPAAEQPYKCPEHWRWMRLGALCRKLHYGFTASAKKSSEGVRLLRISDIHRNHVDWSSVPGCDIADEEVGRYKLERGDLLVARTGGTVGKTFLVDAPPVVAVFASYLIRLQPGDRVSPRFLKLYCESPLYWRQLIGGARGGAQPNVNGQTLSRMMVPVPPLPEQRRIVAKVDELMALCDRLEAGITAGEDVRCRLLESVLHRALNPQIELENELAEAIVQ